MIAFKVNGTGHTYSGDPDMPLLWYLRDTLALTGAKYGCGAGLCGACTVHLDGQALRSCVIPMRTIAEREVTTVEAFDGTHPVQRAWIDEDVAQCGYCQTGQIMAAIDLLQRHPTPTDQQIDALQSNLCRCGTYYRIRKAIHVAAGYARAGSTDADE